MLINIKINLHIIFIIFLIVNKQNFNMDVFSGNIENVLKQILEQQIQYEKNGQYTEAEQCRQKYEKQKQDYRNQTMADMNARHKNEQDGLQKSRNDQLQKFNNFWNSKMDQYERDGKKMEEDLNKKHEDDLNKTRDQLDRTLPLKVKESSELLNLRRMEEHMAKQKNYPQAQKIQQKIALNLQREKQIWQNNRKSKMQSALNTLRGKQKTELTNLQKRIATSRAEKNLDRKKQEQKINLKYDNFQKDLKKTQQKEVLAFKGQFKSLGGTAMSSPAKTRSSFGSSQGSNK